MTELDRDRPIFKTRHLAKALGMSQQFVRDQLDAKKITAVVNRKFGNRRTIRFSWNNVHTYDSDAADRLLREWETW